MEIYERERKRWHSPPVRAQPQYFLPATGRQNFLNRLALLAQPLRFIFERLAVQVI